MRQPFAAEGGSMDTESAVRGTVNSFLIVGIAVLVSLCWGIKEAGAQAGPYLLVFPLPFETALMTIAYRDRV